MYYDPTNTVVSSASLQQPILFVHRLSGSYFAQAGDLQLKQDPLTGNKDQDKSALWVLTAYDITDDGTVLYRITNVGSGQVMAIWFDPNNPSKPPVNQPILFQKPTPDREIDSVQALSQLWIFQPVADRSHVISPARFPGLSLGPWTNNPATVTGCDRIPSRITPDGGDNDSWLHHHRIHPYPRPQKDPMCHDDGST